MDRNTDYLECCRQVMQLAARRGRRMTLVNVATRAMMMQPRCHYVEFDTALKHVRLLRRGHQADTALDYRRAQYGELWEQTRRVLDRKKLRSLPQALAYVLNFRRPSRFYMSITTGTHMLRSFVDREIAAAGGVMPEYISKSLKIRIL